MSQTVTVYRWDDAGAPQIPNGKPSEILDVLTKCLVDGYGAKAPLGWTRPYYDAAVQAAVFRNNVASGGSGGYAKFYSNDASDSNNAIMRVTHAVSMTGLNDFFRQGYTQAFQSTGGVSTVKMDKWVLIGTAIGFYFIINRNTAIMADSSYNAAMYVGDFYSCIASDTSKFITISSPLVSDSTSVSSNDTLNVFAANVTAANAPLKIYHADNFEGFNNYALAPFVGSGGTSSLYTLEITTEHILMPWFIRMTGQNYNTTTTLDRLGVLINNSVVSPLFRGVLPGVGSSLKAGYSGNSWPVIRPINGINYWLMKATAASTGCNAWINTEVWNDPFGYV